MEIMNNDNSDRILYNIWMRNVVLCFMEHIIIVNMGIA